MIKDDLGRSELGRTGKLKIDPWPQDKVAGLPDHIRHFFDDPNTRRGFDFNHPNKPANMRSEAPGISPSRWEKE